MSIRAAIDADHAGKMLEHQCTQFRSHAKHDGEFPWMVSGHRREVGADFLSIRATGRPAASGSGIRDPTLKSICIPTAHPDFLAMTSLSDQGSNQVPSTEWWR